MSALVEVMRAVGGLGLAPDRFTVVAAPEADAVRQCVMDRFVQSRSRRWWWENFDGAAVEVADGSGYTLLPLIVPDRDQRVWFIADDESDDPQPVFDTTVALASAVLGECYAFEYYLVAKDLSWLVGENHHNVVMAVGPMVEGRLTAYAGV